MNVYPHSLRPFVLERTDKACMVFDDVGRQVFVCHSGDEATIKATFKRMARALGITGCRLPEHLPPSGNTE